MFRESLAMRRSRLDDAMFSITLATVVTAIGMSTDSCVALTDLW